MRKDHIIDRLLNIVVIIAMLVTSIIMYNTVIDLIVDEPDYNEYGCIDYEDAETETDIIELNKIDCSKDDAYIKKATRDYYTQIKRNIITEVYVLLLSLGLLFLLNKKDLTKKGLVTKILNTILVLITYGGLIGFGALIINEIFNGIRWENIIRTFGLILLPVVFYIVINKFIVIDKPEPEKETKKKRVKKMTKKKTK